jgi:hypothetical protein
VSIVRWNRKEAGGKPSRRGTRTASGVRNRTSLQGKAKSDTTKGCERKCGGDMRESQRSYPGDLPTLVADENPLRKGGSIGRSQPRP